MINRFIKKIDDLINSITVTFFIMFLIFGAYALYDAYTVHNTAKLSSDILNLKPLENNKEQFTLKPLQDINPDICAWIKINDTNIDYPIVIGKDNSQYLNTDYKKEYATSGSIFLDYRNQRNFVDDYSIVYGHNMKSGLMFSDIKKFENAEFFEQHKYGILYTEIETYKMEIFCIAKVNAFSNDIYDLVLYKNDKTKQLINTFNLNASFKRQLEFTGNDKLILLSTCSSSGSNDRLVLVARLCKYDNDELLIDQTAEQSLEKIERQKDKEEESFKPYENNDANYNKRFRLNISTRTLVIRILEIIVAILFIIFIVKNVKIHINKRFKTKKETEEKEKTHNTKKESSKKNKAKKEKINKIAKIKEIIKRKKNKIKKEGSTEKKEEKTKGKKQSKKNKAKKEKVNIITKIKEIVLKIKNKIKQLRKETSKIEQQKIVKNKNQG